MVHIDLMKSLKYIILPQQFAQKIPKTRHINNVLDRNDEVPFSSCMNYLALDINVTAPRDMLYFKHRVEDAMGGAPMKSLSWEMQLQGDFLLPSLLVVFLSSTMKRFDSSPGSFVTHASAIMLRHHRYLQEF